MSAAVPTSRPPGQAAEADERRLVEAAQQNPAAFAELYELHFARVYAYLARRARDRAEAEDLTSDVFQRALANLPRFEWRGLPFAAWLLRIAANALADRWKQAKREEVLQSAGAESPAASEIDTVAVERQAQLFRWVGQLPAGQRRVVEMRFAEEKSIREIAREMGRTEGAVKQLQFRALESLRARMGETHG